VFISLEGLDGAGKSTQVERLAARLAEDGRDVVTTRDPAGTPLGARLLELVAHGPPLAPWAEAALFTAARAQLVAEVIAPAVLRGADVISDRYLDSTAAYQGAGRELGLRRILEFNLPATLGLIPDRTFLLQVDPALARERAGGWPNWIEREDDSFRSSVNWGYRQVALMFPDRVQTVDSSRPPDAVASEIYDCVRELYRRPRTAARDASG
jgi:dTMP kinase